MSTIAAALTLVLLAGDTVVSAPVASGQDSQSSRNSQSAIKFSITEHDLYPESIAFDPVSGDYFLSSMSQPRIIRIHGDGSYEDFLPVNVPELASSIGMKVDAKRRSLWVCTGRFSLLADHDTTPPRTGVLQFNIDTGKFVHSWMLDQESPYHIFNDIELATGAVVPLVIPDDEALGTDGLYYHDGSLILVKPRYKKITRVFLDDDLLTMSRVESLVDNHPDLAYPTTGVLVGDALIFVATSFADTPRSGKSGAQHPDVLIHEVPLD